MVLRDDARSWTRARASERARARARDATIDAMSRFARAERDLVAIRERARARTLKPASTRSVGAGVGLLTVATALCVMAGASIGNKLFDVVSVRHAARDHEREATSGLSGVRRLTAEKMELDMERYPKARCLDGTPGAYYVNLAPIRVRNVDDEYPSAKRGSVARAGDSSGGSGSAREFATSKTWVVMLQGGGECTNAPECSERSGTERGSSELLPDEIVFDRGIQAVTADDDGEDLPFSRANMVTVGYCSGDVYMGRSDEADASGMWHSGAHIVEAVLQELVRAYNIEDADVIVLAGRSAGGIGLIAQVDQWAELLRTKFSAIARSTVKIVGAPFAGFHYFHNDTEGAADDSLKYIPWDEASFKQYVDYWHASESLPKACVEVNQDAPWRCMVADYSFPHTRTPLFFSQALLDSVVMRLHDNFGGDFTRHKQVTFAHEWQSQMRRVLEPAMSHATAGVFAPSCYMHTDFDGIVIDGISHHRALAEWVFENKPIRLIDDCRELMCNPTCRSRDKSSTLSNDLDDGALGHAFDRKRRKDEDELSAEKVAAERKTDDARARRKSNRRRARHRPSD